MVNLFCEQAHVDKYRYANIRDGANLSLKPSELTALLGNF